MRGIKSGGSGGGKATIKVGVEVGFEHGCAFVSATRSAWPVRIALVVVIGSFQTTAGYFMFSRPPSSICMHSSVDASVHDFCSKIKYSSVPVSLDAQAN
jgi:hypothetical protein